MDFGEEQKGITIITLVITVIVLMIISGIGITMGTNAIKSTKDNKLTSELVIVQQAILEQYTKYQVTKDSSYLLGDKVKSEEMNQIAKDLNIQLASIPDTYSNKEYYRLDKASLLKMGIQDAEDEYIVNYISGEVINITKKTTSNNALYIRANSFYQ